MQVYRFLAIVAGLAISISTLSAQRSGTSMGASSVGIKSASPTFPNPSSPLPSMSPTGSGPLTPSTRQPIYITGKVVMSDGSAPPDLVSIERFCGGSAHTETHTDAKGNFNFQLGQNEDSFVEAGEESGFQSVVNAGVSRSPQADWSNCEIRATLPGFRSDPVSLANRRFLENPDVGTIILHRLANVRGLTISGTTALAPKDAQKAYQKGLQAASKYKLELAQKDFQRAVGIYPRYAIAWLELGKVYERRNQLSQAREAYSRAVAADPDYINPYEQLYVLAFKESKWQEVADTSDRALRLDPYDFPGAFYYNAVANLQLRNLDVAEKSAREAIKLDTQHRNPKTAYVLGLVLAVKRNFAEAAQYLRAYLAAVPNAPDAAFVRNQLAQTERLAKSAAAQP